jgi:hypothetical protein
MLCLASLAIGRRDCQFTSYSRPLEQPADTIYGMTDGRMAISTDLERLLRTSGSGCQRSCLGP